MLHRIIVKYTTSVTDRDAFAGEVLELFKSTEQIPGIHEVRVIPGLPLAPNRYDLMIEIEMEKDALEAYNDSPAHLTWKRDYARFVESKAIFDCLS